jgi:hypothetical protein
VEVRGNDEAGRAFVEETRTRNISAGGLCFESARHVAVGGRLALVISIPPAMRKHFGGQSVYEANAVVCRVERFEDGAVSRVGVRFVSRTA